MNIVVHHKGFSKVVTDGDWQAVADAMLKEHGGPWEADGNGTGRSRIERTEAPTIDEERDANDAALLAATSDAPTHCAACGNPDCPTVSDTPAWKTCPAFWPSPMAPNGPAPTTSANSDFGAVVHDADAAQRIQGTYDKLEAAGVAGIMREQTAMGYKPGDRMADVGYATQAKRAIEHDRKQSLRDCVGQLVNAVEAEKRRDVTVSAKDFADKLACDKALTFDGYKVREQAIRGLLARLESPALRYVLGLRDRIAASSIVARDVTSAAGIVEQAKLRIANDKAELIDVLAHEARTFGHVMLKLRLRDALGDAFACVSPEYAPADAPDALRDVVAMLPDGTKATFSYDPASTAWELRAAIFTPTSVEEQAVGEPFEGYASFRSRDNGTRTWTGGGGILILQCLNASTYEAANATSRRRHIGRILTDVPAMVAAATASISVLCEAWGVARSEALECIDAKGAMVPIEQAIPGFYRHMLTARKGELVGILPGRTEKHVKALALAYDGERRDSTNVTRADLAQGFTKYIQTQTAPVRRDAESAIGAWTVNREAIALATV